MDHNNKYFAVIFHISLIITFLGSCAAFYYFNYVLIINSRHLHPLYLLILFVIMSLLIVPSFYFSIFKSENYKMTWNDIKYIYAESKSGIVLFTESTQKTTSTLYVKVKTKLMKFKSKFQKKKND